MCRTRVEGVYRGQQHPERPVESVVEIRGVQYNILQKFIARTIHKPNTQGQLDM